MFSPKDLEQAAELLGALVYDHDLRRAVIGGQRRRARAFALETVEPQVKSMLESVA
jgi:hypothetical protein